MEECPGALKKRGCGEDEAWLMIGNLTLRSGASKSGLPDFGF